MEDAFGLAYLSNANRTTLSVLYCHPSCKEQRLCLVYKISNLEQSEVAEKLQLKLLGRLYLWIWDSRLKINLLGSDQESTLKYALLAVACS
jgi:hypothetical protein